MFPFVFDPRPTASLFSNSKRVTRSSSRGTNVPSEVKDSFPPPPSSYPTSTPPRYAIRSSSGSSSGHSNTNNSLRNPYAFVQPRPSYSPSSSTKKRSPSSTSSSASSTKSRLAAINSAYDSQYGEFSGHGTAEEIRNSQHCQTSSHPAPDVSFTDPSVSRSRTSSSSTSSDEDTSSASSRSLRRLVKDKTKAVLGIKRSGSTSSDDGDDQDRLMEDERQ